MSVEEKDMKLGSKIWIHLKDEILLNRAAVLLSGTLAGETSEAVTIAAGCYIFVIRWQNIICLEKLEVENKL